MGTLRRLTSFVRRSKDVDVTPVTAGRRCRQSNHIGVVGQGITLTVPSTPGDCASADGNHQEGAHQDPEGVRG